MSNPQDPVKAWMESLGFEARYGHPIEQPLYYKSGMPLIDQADADFFYRESLKSRIDELLGMGSFLSGLGVGGKGKYQDGFRDSIEQIQIALQDALSELEAQLQLMEETHREN